MAETLDRAVLAELLEADAADAAAVRDELARVISAFDVARAARWTA